MANEFKDKTKSLFIWLKYCILCNDYSEDLVNHHIVGRVGKYNDSPLNLGRVCGKCHEKLHGVKGEEKEMLIALLLIRTFIYLTDSVYLLSDNDEEFYDTNEKYYQLFSNLKNEI
jgi:hypothetical protein